MGQGPGHYLQVDFDGWLTLSRLVLTSGGTASNDFLHGYELLASADGVNFNRVLASGSQALPPLGGIQIIDFFATPMRAMRINSIKPSGNPWSIYELNVDCYGQDSAYDDDLSCNPTVTSAGAGGVSGDGDPTRERWSATASRSTASGLPAATFDGDLATSWSTGGPQTSTDWFQLDLGSVSCVTGLTVAWPDAEAANAYTVEVSEDAVKYVEVAEGLGEAQTEISFPPHSLRFIRINQLGSGASNWWRIQELQVHSRLEKPAP
jgi:hypothetical protein